MENHDPILSVSTENEFSLNFDGETVRHYSYSDDCISFYDVATRESFIAKDPATRKLGTGYIVGTMDCNCSVKSRIKSGVAVASGTYCTALIKSNPSIPQYCTSDSVALTTGANSTSQADDTNSLAVTFSTNGIAIANARDSVAIALGVNSVAKATLGSFITCSEWDATVSPPTLLDVKSTLVDGETIESDTYYTLKHGNFTKVPATEVNNSR